MWKVGSEQEREHGCVHKSLKAFYCRSKKLMSKPPQTNKRRRTSVISRLLLEIKALCEIVTFWGGKDVLVCPFPDALPSPVNSGPSPRPYVTPAQVVI